MSVTSLATAAYWLKYPSIPLGNEGIKLQETLDAAESYVARRTGCGNSLAVRSVTQRASGRGYTLTLTTLPIVSVTSVTASDGTVLSVPDLDIDTAAGLIGFSPLAQGYFGASSYTVVYQAGFTVLDPAYVGVVKEATREFWGAQRGGSVQSGGGPPDDGTARAEVDRLIATLPHFGFA